MAWPVTLAYPCAMATADSSCRQSRICGRSLPRWLTSESCRPRKLAPGLMAMYSMPSDRKVSATASLPNSAAPTPVKVGRSSTVASGVSEGETVGAWTGSLALNWSILPRSNGASRRPLLGVSARVHFDICALKTLSSHVFVASAAPMAAYWLPARGPFPHHAELRARRARGKLHARCPPARALSRPRVAACARSRDASRRPSPQSLDACARSHRGRAAVPGFLRADVPRYRKQGGRTRTGAHGTGRHPVRAGAELVRHPPSRRRRHGLCQSASPPEAVAAAGEHLVPSGRLLSARP